MYNVTTTELTPLRFAADQTPQSEFRRVPAVNKSGYITSDLKPDERLATEPPGEELAPDSSIWRIYLDEAKEQDTELVEEKNKNLDVMLLFAALFSAVLTAFLIESKKLLQQDSADLSATLLLAIAQSQQRLEQGTPQATPPVERPQFSSPLSARWVNGLWFTALSLSLGAALVAMLAKEWVNAFMASRPRPPKSYALVHQARLRGLVQWRALHIVDFLPTMLHLSLLLFSLGLALYLWTLDKGIAIAEIIVTAITVLFYVATALCGATCSSCPFDTQMSKYLRALIPPAFKDMPGSENSLNASRAWAETTNDELRALLWLMQNARDPAVCDCACQALVGLHNMRPTPSQPQANSEKPSSQHIGPAETSQGEDTTADENEKPSGPPTGVPQLPSERYALTSQLYDGVHTRFRQAMLRLPQEFEDRRGRDMARYANVLPELVYALETRAKDSEQEPYDLTKSSAISALGALDDFWKGNLPVLNPDVYALLVAAELRLTEAITSVHHSNSSPSTPRPLSAGNNDRSGASGAVIDMRNIPDDNISLFQLRARYSRSLARAGYLLGHHGTRRGSISIQPLVYLLESMRLAAQCADLNPESHMSTCLPQQRDADVLPLFQMTVTSGPAFAVEPLRVGDKDSVIAGLVGVICSAGTGDVYSVELAAGRALFVIGPILFRQWVHMMKNRPEDSNRDTSALQSVERVLNNWPPLDRKPNRDWGVAQWTLRQLLVIATIAVSLIDYAEVNELVDMTIHALYQRANTQSGRGPMFNVGRITGGLLADLARYTQLNHDKISSSTVDVILQLLATKRFGRTIFRIGVVPSGVPHVLRLLAKTPNHLAEVQLVLSELLEQLNEVIETRESMRRYLPVFTARAEGFASLASVAEQPEYKLATVNCIMQIVHMVKQYQILAPAVPSLLDATRLVVDDTLSRPKRMGRLEPFMSDIMSILHSLHPEARRTAKNCPTLSTIHQLLKSKQKLPEGLAGIVLELETWMHDGVVSRGELEQCPDASG